MDKYELIKEAIANKYCMAIKYRGRTRKVLPHVLGKKEGVLQALFYQYEGGSTSGLSSDKEDNWRCLALSKITIIDPNIHENVTSPDNYSLVDQSCIDDIHAAIPVKSS